MTDYKTTSDDGRMVLVQATEDSVTVACATCGEPFTYKWTQTDHEEYATPGAFAEYCLENMADNSRSGAEDEHQCSKADRLALAVALLTQLLERDHHAYDSVLTYREHTGVTLALRLLQDEQTKG